MITYEKLETVQQHSDVPRSVFADTVEPFIQWTLATVERFFETTPELRPLKIKRPS